MSIYERIIEAVQKGDDFYVNFKTGTLKIDDRFIIADNKLCEDTDERLLPEDMETSVFSHIEELYHAYKYSTPSYVSSEMSSYFTALSSEELNEYYFLTGEQRHIAQVKLEAYIACLKVKGLIEWTDNTSWFWQSKTDPDLVLLKKWVA